MSTVDQAEAVNDAIGNKPPVFPRPFDNTVQLYRGVKEIVDGETKFHTVATVRELTGHDEEALDKYASNQDRDYFDYTSEVIRRGLVGIGNVEQAAMPVALGKLILPDRDLIFLAIIKATYGVTRDIRVTCRSCGTLNDIEVHLDDDFPRLEPTIDPKAPLYVTLSSGKKVEFRLPNGEDTRHTLDSGKESDSTVASNTAIIANCAVLHESEDATEWARSLSMKDRRTIISALSVTFGPQMEGVNTHCAKCEAEMSIALDWVSLLLA
jgi:hypothetical protein